MTATTKKEPAKILMLPEGRLMFSSLFEKDAYTPPGGTPGTPKYKVEIVFDPADLKGDGKIEDDLANFAADTWGDAWFQKCLDGKVETPFKDGDDMADNKAEKGKTGDAYRGKIVVRADTTFNRHGENGPGGIAVFDEANQPITQANATAIYSGCMVQAAVTMKAWGQDTGKHAIKFYLVAVQKVGDGERLVAARDNSSLFKPVGKPAGEASAETGRRKRG